MSTYLTAVLLVISIAQQFDNLPEGGGIKEGKYTVSDSLTITLTDPWLLSSSLELTLNDSLPIFKNDFVYKDSLQLITFLSHAKIVSGDSITVRYVSVAVVDSLNYQRFHLTERDSSAILTDKERIKTKKRSVDPMSSWQNMRRSGSITRGVRFGSGSEGGVTSGLHLELSGRPKPDMEVDAIIDDRNMPATKEGASVSLAELDKLLFQVNTPHLNARLGDWDLSWNKGRYASFERRLKGGNIAVDYSAVRSDLAAAGGNNSYNSVSFFGRDGDLGPYELSDQNGNPGVTVVSGSERVYLNGVLLRRGRRADYEMDYSRGRITFNPQHPIRSDSRIEAEYEYSDDIYPRYFYAASGEAPNLSNSGLSFSAAVISEGRDKENPLAFEWTDESRNALEVVGDNPFGAFISGIDSVGMNQGDYLWRTDNGDSILVFSQPDSIGHPTGYLNVVFSQQIGGGYSRIYDTDLQAFYYEWVGLDSGEWAPVQLIPLPDKTNLLDVVTKYETGRLSMSAEAAFSSYDRNTLSSINDDDNNGAAWFWTGDWNADESETVTLNASVRHEDERFHPINRNNDVDYNYTWNLPEDSTTSETEINGGGSVRPIEILRLKLNGGYIERGADYKGNRLGIGTDWDLKQLNISTQIDQINGENKLNGVNSQALRAFGSAYRETGRLRPMYSLSMEKKQVGGAAPLDGNQYLEHTAGLEIDLTSYQQLDLRFKYRFDDDLNRNGTKHFSDTRTLNSAWQLRQVPWGGISLNMLRYYQTYSSASIEPVTSTAAGIETSVAPRESLWRLKVNYNLVTGSDRSTVQVANYVGEGNGGYIREGDRYVSDPDGDFNLYEAVTDTLQRVSRVDFSGQFNKDFRKRKGSSGDTETYPLGVSSLYFRFDANITTTENDPYRAFLLYPHEFDKHETILAKRDFLTEVNFLEGNPKGDGKLKLRRIINRNRAIAGGEKGTIDRINLLTRPRLTEALRMQLSPAYERAKRGSLVSNETLADVTGIGVETGLTLHYPLSPFEYGLTYGYDRRRDSVQDAGVDERRLAPRFTWTIGTSGRLRVEGVWRYLTATTEYPGYDLARGWVVGNNWTLDVGLDYNIGNNVTATAYFRGRWRGDYAPSNSGLIEFSAKL
ncbi:hypothetical protein K9N50_05665 [bacterium]|nr:hypothetical protein [bacterium]